MAKPAKLVLVDGHALIHRAFHAIPFLSTKDGELTNAVFGFVSTVLSVLKELEPKYIAVSFDLPEPTFRHAAYKDYKATRQKAPDELRSQFGRVREVVEVLNMPIFEMAGYEADDVIGSLAKQNGGKDLDVYIVTGDKDTLQLVDDHVSVFTLRKGIKDTVIYDRKMLLEETGLTPDEFVEFKALKGDASDNIPGVPGIGDKTATSLVREYKSLEKLYEILEDEPAKHPLIKPKVRANLIENRDQAFLSRDLSRIKTDLDIPFKLEDSRVHDFDMDRAMKLFKDMEFTSLVPRLQSVVESKLPLQPEMIPKPSDQPRDWSKKKYVQVSDEKAFKDFLADLQKQGTFAFDTETEVPDPLEKGLVGLSFSWARDTGYYLPLAHKDGLNLDLTRTLKALKPVFENAKALKVGHNLKYDSQVLFGYGINITGLHFDTMLGSYLLNPGARTLNLGRLAYQEFGYEMQPIAELIGEKKPQLKFSEVPVADATKYASEDADITWQLYEKFAQQLADVGLSKLLSEIELPLVPVLARMERHGVRLDTVYMSGLAKSFDANLRKLERKIYKLAGREFNINSPAQLAVILFDELKVGVATRKRATQHRSTAAEKLETLKDSHPIVPEITRHRELAKLRSTYIEALPKLVRPDTKRIHTSYNQTVAATGRLSSSDPNLQNIPIRTEIGREIRKAFVAEKGFSLISADYSQFELRIAAHISGDKELTKNFRDGIDIHTATAARVAGVEVADVTKEQRYAAKAVNFSILYGAGPHGLSRTTGMSVPDAQAYIDRYFETYPKLREYMDAMIAKATSDGYVETLFGRRRYLPEINASVYPIRQAAKRMAINMPIQGTQADILKKAMITIDEGLAKVSRDARMILTVHDEIVVETPTKSEIKVGKLVTETMANAYELSVPIVVEAKAGPNWEEMKPLSA